MTIRFALAVLVALLFAWRANAAPIPIESPARAAAVNFESEILPVLRVSCLPCHNQQKAEGHLVLESPQTILKGGDSGPAVVPGKGAESLLLKVAAHQQESFMPPSENQVGAKNLTPAQLGLIKLWIDQGATGIVSSSRSVRWQPLATSYQPIFATAVTPDGQYGLCSRGNRLFVYHLPTGKLATMLVDPALATTSSQPVVDAAHQDVIRALAVDGTGDLVASAGFREVKIWRRPRVQRLAEWSHDAPLQSVAVSEGGRLAATGDESGKVRIWEVATNKSLHSIAAHQGPVTGVAFSTDGTALFSCSADKSLRAWTVADAASVGTIVQSAAPLVAISLINNGEWLVTAEADGMARVWETKSLLARSEGELKSLKEIKVPGGPLTSVAPMPGQPLEFLTGGEDGVVRRWNVESGAQVREYRHDATVTAIAVRADGKRIASAGANYINLFNADDGQQVAQRAGDPRLAAKVAKIEAEITFTKNGIASAQQDIKNYEGPERRVMVTAQDVKKAEEEKVKAEKTRDEKKQAFEKAKAESKNVEGAENAFKDAETAVVVAGTIIERAKVVAERAVKELADAQTDVKAREERLKALEVEKGAAVEAAKANQPVRSLAFSPDNHRLIAGCEDGTLHSYDAESGTYAESSADHSAAVRALAFTKDLALVAASADKRAIVCGAASHWKLERTMGSGEQAALLADRVLALDFSPDGKWLATGGGVPSRGGELKIWSLSDGQLVREIKDSHSDAVFAVRFSPDGARLASAGADRLVKVFDVQSGECVKSLAGHTAHVLGLSWKADGRLLASCGTDKVIKLWDLEKGVPLRTMKGTTYQIGAYKREVSALAFIGDSEEIAAVCGDGTVRLHRCTSDGDILTFKDSGAGYQYSVSATPDGQAILAGGSDGILRLYSGRNLAPKTTFAH